MRLQPDFTQTHPAAAAVLRLQRHLPACAVQDEGFHCGRMPGVPEHPGHCWAGITSDPWGLQHRCGGWRGMLQTLQASLLSEALRYGLWVTLCHGCK